MTDAESVQAAREFKGLQFNDLLWKHGYDVNKVLIIRHAPMEPELKRVLPWLASEKPEIFNAYQRTQGEDAEKRLIRRDYLASFIATETANECSLSACTKGPVAETFPWAKSGRFPATGIYES